MLYTLIFFVISTVLSFVFQIAENRCCSALDRACRVKEEEAPDDTPPASLVEMAALHATHGTPLSSGKPIVKAKELSAMEKLTARCMVGSGLVGSGSWPIANSLA